MNFVGGKCLPFKNIKVMGKMNRKTFQKTDLEILKMGDSHKYHSFLKVLKKSKPYDSYFYVKEKCDKKEIDAFWIASEKYEPDYLSFLFNSSIGKELLFGETCNPYIDNDIAESSIEYFKVIEVSRKKQEKYGLLERKIQYLMENNEDVDKLVELRDALAVELYDNTFLKECHTDLFDKWQPVSGKDETENLSNILGNNYEDWADIVEYINLLSDDIIKEILKEIKG